MFRYNRRREQHLMTQKICVRSLQISSLLWVKCVLTRCCLVVIRFTKIVTVEAIIALKSQV